jgi:glycosyltransferase involved in cell wall biosynthesis
MNKKIVLLGPYPPPYGGVSIYISTLFEFLKNRGVHLWTYGDREISGPNVHYLKDKRRDLIPLILAEGRGARVADCTHFLVEYPSALVPLWVILKRLLRFEWIKIVQDGSLPSRYKDFNFLRRALFRLSVRSVDEFIAVNEELERWLRHEIGVKQKIALVMSLFPVPYRDAETHVPADTQAALEPFRRRAKRVCSIGVFIREYGFAHVAEAVERLRLETNEDIGLVLLDGDFAKDDEYRAEVLRNRDWIVVLKNVAHSLVFQILKQSDVFVRGFGLESYGLSRVEAIWCGLPVVATRAGETRGMLLYDFGDVEELVAQLKRALSGEQAGKTMEWAARYQEEAGENLRAISEKLGIGTQASVPHRE